MNTPDMTEEQIQQSQKNEDGNRYRYLADLVRRGRATDTDRMIFEIMRGRLNNEKLACGSA